MSGTAILLATRSQAKLRELHPFFAAARVPVIDLRGAGIAPTADEEAIEIYSTFEENSLAKARYFRRVSGGMETMADDSGLEVAALDGLPGVASKRWSGRGDLEGQALDDANNAELLRRMAAVADRSARYVCAAAYVDDRRELVRRGVAEGRITRTPRGVRGFGYDPYFESVDLGKTFGESERSEKERISHRGRAFRSLLAALRGES